MMMQTKNTIENVFKTSLDNKSSTTDQIASEFGGHYKLIKICIIMILMITCKPINPSLHNCGVCASKPPNMHADMKKVNKFAALVLVKPAGK